jgi:hypothetical protein
LAYLKKRMVTEGRYSEPEISSLLIIHLSWTCCIPAIIVRLLWYFYWITTRFSDDRIVGSPCLKITLLRTLHPSTIFDYCVPHRPPSQALQGFLSPLISTCGLSQSFNSIPKRPSAKNFAFPPLILGLDCFDCALSFLSCRLRARAFRCLQQQ